MFNIHDLTYCSETGGIMRKKNLFRKCAMLLAGAMILETVMFSDELMAKAYAAPTTEQIADEEIIDEVEVMDDVLEAADTSETDDVIEDNIVESEHLYSGKPGRDDLEKEPLDDFSGVFGDEGIEAVLPAKYIPSLDETPYFRNQDQFGTCYSFASIGAIEANMIKNAKKYNLNKDDIDYSELALAYFTTHTAEYKFGGCEGDKNYYNPDDIAKLEDKGNFSGVESGNPCFTAGVLASWTGATAESKVPYTGKKADLAYKVSVDDEYAFDDEAHITNWYVVNCGITSNNGDKKKFEAGIETLKTMIRKCGGATLAYGAGAYTGTDGYSYYNHVDKQLNHFVTVVGWDDNYDRGKFDYDGARPAGNGAWLCRNSWSSGDYEGESVEDNLDIGKFFYISYYDTSIIDAYAFEVEPYDNYDYNYQYDLAADYTYLPYNKAANVFTVHGDDENQILDAVAFTTNGVTNIDYQVDIYLNPQNGNPESGTHIESATTTGKTTYCGYYTIPLAKSVPLKNGDKFAVVFTLSKAGSSYTPGFQIEYSSRVNDPGYWYYSEIGIQENTSFYAKTNRSGESTWYDLYKDYSRYNRRYGNVRIKAFTNAISSYDYNEEITDVTISYKENAPEVRVGSNINKTDFKVTKTIKRTIGGVTGEPITQEISNQEYNFVSISPETVPLNAEGSTYTVAVTYKQGEEFTKTVDVDIPIVNKPEEGPKPLLPQYSVGFVDDINTFTYTGTAIKPADKVVVMYGDTILEANKDYTLSFGNNINVASVSSKKAPYVTVKGKGNYSGTLKAKFNIAPKPISDEEIKCTDILMKVNTKNGQKPTPSIVLGKKKLGKADILKIEYLNSDEEPLDGNKIPISQAEDYIARVYGKGNYTGYVDVPVKIVGNLMSSVSVALYKQGSNKASKSFTYTGEEICPVVKVTAKLGNKKVVLSANDGIQGDFDVVYQNNTGCGTATIILKGLPDRDNGFYGEKKITFAITGESLAKKAKLEIVPEDKILTYDGTEKCAGVKVKRKDTGDVLNKDVDYIVSYSKNINVGKATVTVTGIGKYSGKLSAQYKIAPAKAGTDITDIKVSDVTYLKNAAMTPEPVITYGVNNFVKGKDYTVVYQNNKAAADKESEKAPTCKITFKGNYSGSVVVPFSIIPKSIDLLEACGGTISNEPEKYEDGNLYWYKPTQRNPVVVDDNGLPLRFGTDFKVEGYYSDLECNNSINLEYECSHSEKNGMDYYVKLNGIGNYTGECVARGKMGIFMLIQNLEDVSFSTKNLMYQNKNPYLRDFVTKSIYKGNVYEIRNNRLVKTAKSVDMKGEDFSYCKVVKIYNNKKGKATVLLEGFGNFGGFKLVTVNVVTNSMK